MGYIESFNGKIRDELMNRELFHTLEEARGLIEQWRREYDHIRRHSAKDYRLPAPEAILIWQRRNKWYDYWGQVGLIHGYPKLLIRRIL